MPHQGPTASLAGVFMIAEVDHDGVFTIGCHPQIVAHADRDVRGIVKEVVGSRRVALAVVERIDLIGIHAVSTTPLLPTPRPSPRRRGDD